MLSGLCALCFIFVRSATCILFNRCMRLSCGNSLNTYKSCVRLAVAVCLSLSHSLCMCVHVTRLSPYFFCFFRIFCTFGSFPAGTCACACAYAYNCGCVCVYFSTQMKKKTNPSNFRFELHATFDAATLKNWFWIRGKRHCSAPCTMHRTLSHHISNW